MAIDYTSPCPYCRTICECDLVDVGVGYVQSGPYHCENCGAVEAGAYDDKPEDLARVDPKTGWFPPSDDPVPGSSANMVGGKLASVRLAKGAYYARFAGSPDYDVPGCVEDWWTQQRGRS